MLAEREKLEGAVGVDGECGMK